MPKSERLCGRTYIRLLFSEGQSFYVQGLKVQYRLTERQVGNEAPVRVMIVAPKRNYRRAHDRNRHRRRIREAWRLQKITLYETVPDGFCLHVGIVYLHKRPEAWVTLQSAVGRALAQLIEKVAVAKAADNNN